MPKNCHACGFPAMPCGSRYGFRALVKYESRAPTPTDGSAQLAGAGSRKTALLSPPDLDRISERPPTGDALRIKDCRFVCRRQINVLRETCDDAIDEQTGRSKEPPSRPLLALSGHRLLRCTCLLLGVKRTWREHRWRVRPCRVHVAWSCRVLLGSVGNKGEQTATHAT